VLALLILLELTGRLSLVAALLAVPRSSTVAAAIAGVSALTSLARALAKGSAVARETERAWRELARGIQRTDLFALAADKSDPHHVSMLVDSVREVAAFRSTAVAELVSDALALVAVGVFALVKLPVYASLIAAGALVIAAIWVRATRKAQHAAQRDAFEAFADVARDAEALVEGGLELRAHAAEETHLERLLAGAGRMAAAEKRAWRTSAASAALPSALAVALVIAPQAWLHELAERVGWLDVGVVGAMGLSLATSLARDVDAVARSTVLRGLFARFASTAAPTRSASSSEERLRSIQFDGVSVLRGDAKRATPARLDLELEAGGLALTGDNGAGKSSAILALLGFVAPFEGAVRANGELVDEARFAWLRSRIGFVPQRSFVATSEPLSFHAALAGVADLVALDAQCRRVGLGYVLDRGGFEAPIGSLSGGERQLFFLARAFARNADLVVLDEPEAGLDAGHRASLARWLEEESRDRLVLVAAHDRGVVPASFSIVECADGTLQSP
jgi:manganese/zinc/iron transport system ATP- binding protein